MAERQREHSWNGYYDRFHVSYTAPTNVRGSSGFGWHCIARHMSFLNIRACKISGYFPFFNLSSPTSRDKGLFLESTGNS